MNGSTNRTGWKDILDLHFDTRVRDYVHTSFPAKITKVNDNNTINCQPLVSTKRPDDSVIDYPEIFDVRMQTYACQLGDVYVSLPTRVGDLVWVMVSERDVFNLMKSDGSKPEQSTTLITHDLSDCFAIPAFFPDKRKKDFDKDNLVIANNKTRILVKGGTVVVDGSLETTENLSAGNGATGSFTTPTGQTVTVVNGIVTNIF
jgi:hypothetical protein